MGDYYSHILCCRTKMDGHKQTRTWMRCMEDNFLMQAFHEWTRGEVLLDLLLTNEEELLDDVEFKGNLACRDQETVELKFHRGLNKSNRTTTSPTPGDHVSVSSGPYLLTRVPWETALELRGSQQSWLPFKDSLIRAQRWSSAMWRKKYSWRGNLQGG